MTTARRFGLAAVIVVLAGIAGVLALPSLPEELITNWDAGGEPRGTMPVTWGIAFMPGLMAVFLSLFAVVPRIDPLRENIAAFRIHYDWFVVIFTAYLGTIHLGMLAYNLGYTFDFTMLLLAGMAFLFYYIGIILPHVQRNWFLGIRTPWTLSSDAVWERTHTIGAYLFKLCGVASAIGLLFEDYAIYFVLVPVLGTAIGTIAYSYVLYERLERSDATAV